MKENKYYVYLHRNLAGVVVYVGKGTKSRVISNSNRSPAWREATKDGFTYQIVKSGMMNREAGYVGKWIGSRIKGLNFSQQEM